MHNLTDVIEECEKETSHACLGGSNNFTCEIGYIGPLCKQCDIYGIETDNIPYTYNTPYQCIPCANIKYNLTFLILAILIHLLSISFSVRNTLKNG